MRVLCVALIAVLVLGSGGSATARADTDPLVAPVPFGPGERLVFDIKFGLVNGGEGVLEVLDVIETAGAPCYEIQSKATSNRFFSAFYKVRDKVTSHLDVAGLFSRYFSKRLREGTFKRNVEFRIDHEAGRVNYPDGKEFEVPAGTHDILSSFYYVRTQPLAPGQEYFITTHASEKTYDLRVLVLRRETVKVPAGEFDCLVVQPLMIGEGLFKHEGDLLIWLTDDEHRIPVLLKSKIKIGSVDAELTEYRLGRPLAAQAAREGHGND